ncbi:hypothetical protein F2P45_31550 [Massilia sp. CCM 8733]|uniref:Uncharacterized protein n=1 Tax=Massilia mucilaginosa TaxID=2609282 RepID=A0ABX0P2E8_9BURK|nr:hypothetical protein [Massilia mucilaginosa]
MHDHFRSRNTVSGRQTAVAAKDISSQGQEGQLQRGARQVLLECRVRPVCHGCRRVLHLVLAARHRQGRTSRMVRFGRGRVGG